MRNLIFTCIVAMLTATANAQEPGAVITYAAGEFFISVLSEGGSMANSGLLKDASAEQLKTYLPDGTFLLETQIFLVRANGKNILIDTGHGRNLFANLRKLGISEEKIDAILLTHLHSDHIGGMLLNGKAAFPNAEVYLSQPEYDHWMNRDDGSAARDALAPYRERLRRFVPEAIDQSGSDLLPGIKAVAAYGHTPGHTAFLIRSEDDEWLIWGDVAHAMPIQMPCPEVALAFDTDAAQAVGTRKTILEYAEKKRITVAGMHIPFPAAGKVSKGKSGSADKFSFTPLCLCEGF